MLWHACNAEQQLSRIAPDVLIETRLEQGDTGQGRGWTGIGKHGFLDLAVVPVGFAQVRFQENLRAKEEVMCIG